MYALLLTSDPDDSAILSMALQRAGLAIIQAKDLAKAMKNWSERPADIVVLSLLEPSPKEQVRLVRATTQAPLILTISWADEQLHAELLRQGADLVITLSTNLKLLIAKIGVVMRRANSTPTFSLPNLNASEFMLNTTTRTVERPNQSNRRLTHLEFRLLYTLMINRGRVMPTDTIVEHVWGYTGAGDRDLVRGLVSRLRTKVEANPHQPRYIKTVSGIGYVFEDN